MKIVYSLVVLAVAASAQEAPKQLWAHVDFLSIAEGKGAEFQKAVTEIVAPKYRERSADHAFLSYRRLFPHGSDSGPSNVCIGLSPSIKAAAVPQRTGVAPPGLARTQRGELWRLRHSANLEQFLKAPVVRALFLRLKEGHTSTQVVAIYRQSQETAKRAAENSGLAIFERAFSSGSDDFAVAILWGFPNIEQVGAYYEQPSRSADHMLTLERLSKVRDLMRTELWQRTDLSQ